MGTLAVERLGWETGGVRCDVRSGWRRLGAGIFGMLVAVRAGAQGSMHGDSGERPDAVLHGTVRGGDNHRYIEAPFAVPAGTARVTLRFAYTGREQRTTIDLGLLDPRGLRCWSGGNKSVLTVSETDATPSCLAGRVEAGVWKVLMGVPNIRAGRTDSYTAELFFRKGGLVASEPAMIRAPLRAEARWYRGDLHLHTGHSDGSCKSLAGAKVPCPVFLTAEAAVRRGLDFIAITDHNTTSHYNAMRELAPYFDTLLLIPGREVTTFTGHFNLLGTEEFLDFRLGSAGVPDVNTLLGRANALGGLVSINHGAAPTGENCMGCGWTPAVETDMRLVQAIEAVNGGGLKDGDDPRDRGFWEAQLNAGRRVTGVGGSDNHAPQQPVDEVGSVGSPTTVVFAKELSTAAILEGIRAGHVFVDLTGSKGRGMEVTAQAGAATAGMGDALMAADGTAVRFALHVSGCEGAKVVLMVDGRPMGEAVAVGAERDASTEMVWQSDGRRHWVRAEVRGPEGRLWLLGNPVYVNW